MIPPLTEHVSRCLPSPAREKSVDQEVRGYEDKSWKGKEIHRSKTVLELNLKKMSSHLEVRIVQLVLK